jgi:hypothetical protein
MSAEIGIDANKKKFRVFIPSDQIKKDDNMLELLAQMFEAVLSCLERTLDDYPHQLNDDEQEDNASG